MRHSFEFRTVLLCFMLIGFTVILLHEAIPALLSRVVSSTLSGAMWLAVDDSGWCCKMMIEH